MLTDSNFLSSIRIKGIYELFDCNIDFNEGLTVLFGRNGCGKTTVLHIIANILNENFERFLHIQFREIELIFKSNSIKIERIAEVERKSSLMGIYQNVIIIIYVNGKKKYKFQKFDGLPRIRQKIEKKSIEFLNHFKIAYFPAFRNMIEAWNINVKKKDEKEKYIQPYDEQFERDLPYLLLRDYNYIKYANFRRRPKTSEVTEFARKIFGEFIPDVNYPSISKIENNLSEKVRNIYNNILKSNATYYNEALIEIFNNLIESKSKDGLDLNNIFLEIKNSLNILQKSPFGFEEGKKISSILKKDLKETFPSNNISGNQEIILSTFKSLYSKCLLNHNEKLKEIMNYINATNFFLVDKKLHISSDNEYPVFIKFEEDSRKKRFLILSSGERQIVSMLYTATSISETSNVILIDEPEISLHIDWQRKLIKKMLEQFGSKQIIVCTHSPEIGADFPNSMKDLRFITNH